jgi:hypothetical protein
VTADEMKTAAAGAAKRRTAKVKAAGRGGNVMALRGRK